MIGGSGIRDPFALSDFQKRLAVPSAAGRTLRSSRLNAGEATGVFVIVGQSNGANFGNANYGPTNYTKVDNFNVYDGLNYAPVDPWLGCDGQWAHWAGRLGDKLIAAGKYQRVIVAPIAIGGSYIAQWTPHGNLNLLVGAVLSRLAALGMPATAVLLQHGESDGGGTPQTTYANALLALIAQVRNHGHTMPWLIGKSTYGGGSNSPTIRAALASVVNGTDILEGADTDTFPGLTYRYDDTHWNATGAEAVAALWRDKIVAAL